MAKTERAAAGRTAGPQRYRALIIAPSTDLENANAEVQRVINALHPEVLIGTVTTNDVLDCVQQSDPFDVVWFLGHSGPTGIQLSDGVLSPAHLTQILRPVPPALVVLNSCSSYFIANQLHDDIRCAVICTLISIPDLDAFITGTSLARALAQGMDIPDAYAASKPSDSRTYMLLNGNVRLNGQTEIDDLRRLVTSTSSDIHAELSGVAREMAALRQELAAVRAEQVRVQADLAMNETRFQPVKGRTQLTAWSIGFVLFMLSYAVLEFREILGISVPIALTFSLFIAAVSCWCFVWGLRFRLDR